MDQSITKDIYDKKHQEYADKLQLLEVGLSEHREMDWVNEYPCPDLVLKQIRKLAG